MRLPYRSGTVTLTSRFGWRTLNGSQNYHNGIDLVGTDKTIVSPVDGVVGSSAIITNKNDRTWEWGNFVRIDTDDGLMIFMCHMSQRLVTVGTKVKAGDPIGIEGSTGYSFGSHCHFEIRKNGVSVDPCPYLNIKNEYGVHNLDKPETRPNDYEKNGLIFHKIENFAIKYHDKDKKAGGLGDYINGGFFGYYAEDGIDFTLPVANLVCDVDINSISAPAKKYIGDKIKAGKLRWYNKNNHTDQFWNKKVSTLVVPAHGDPYIDDMIAPPADCKYAISGVPTVRHGDDVDFYNYVKAQGWGEGSMYATYRNWLGIRNGEIWLISGKTSAPNYIYGMEFWNKVKDEKFDDIIALDGGGSYYCKVKSKATTTSGNRQVNNIITMTGVTVQNNVQSSKPISKPVKKHPVLKNPFVKKPKSNLKDEAIAVLKE